jgi:hypothetical protein
MLNFSFGVLLPAAPLFCKTNSEDKAEAVLRIKTKPGLFGPGFHSGCEQIQALFFHKLLPLGFQNTDVIFFLGRKFPIHFFLRSGRK